MQTNVFTSDADWQILHKNNRMELGNWIGHLEYLTLELKNLLKITEYQVFRKTSLSQKILDKNRENEAQLNLYQQYANQLQDTNECQDLDCDRYFLSQHEQYRRMYLYHLEKYRKVKDEIYKIVQHHIYHPSVQAQELHPSC